MGALEIWIAPLNGLFNSSIRKIDAETDSAQMNKVTRTVALRGANNAKLRKMTAIQKISTTSRNVGTELSACAINSQRVFVVGEVLRAGAFPLIPGMTVLQALASAGGFTTFADVKKIHVMRLVNGKHSELPFNYREVLKGDNPDQNIKLEPGDTVVVP